MSVIITCAGSTSVHGIYDYNGSQFIKRVGDGKYIAYSTDRWIIQDAVDEYYYLIETNNENNIIDNGIRTWVVMGGGTLPLPKITYLNYTTCTTLVVAGSSETGANNGVYNLAYTEDPIPEPFYVNSLNAAYTIEQMSLDEGQAEWGLLGAGTVVYGSITVPNGTPPVGNLTGGGSIDLGGSCNIFDCESTPTPTPPAGSGFFVYNNNNTFRLRRSGNSFFIRAS